MAEKWEQWKLRLVNLGEMVDEVMCNGPAPAIEARVYLTRDHSDPDMCVRTTAIVTAQDAHIERSSCRLLVIARVESHGTFPRRDFPRRD